MSNEMINFLSTLISYPSISSNPNNSQDSKIWLILLSTLTLI